MRTERQHDLDRAVCEVLAQMGDVPLAQKILAGSVCRAVAPRALVSEAEESLRSLESRRFISAITGETGPEFVFTQAGRAWWAQHA